VSLLRILCTALLGLQGLGAFLPGPWLWGASHLAYAPAPARLLVPLAGMLLLWTPAGEGFGRWLARRFAPAFFARGWLCLGAAPLAGAIAFWSLRCRSHLLGDGWLLGELVHLRVPFHGFGVVAYHLHERLYRALAWETEAQAFLLFALLSVLAGCLYLIVAAWGARRASADPGERAWLYLLLVWCAPLQLFFGYVEVYALLAVGWTLFALLLAREGGAGRRAAAIALGAALALHLNALFAAPVLLLAALLPEEQEPAGIIRRTAEIAWPPAAGLLAGVGLLLLGGYGPDWFRLDFLQRAPGAAILRGIGGGEGWLRARHLKDLVNLLLLLAPVPLALIAAGCAARRRAGTRLARGEIVLLAGSLWLILLMLLLHLRLGVVRDWDLFAPSAVLFTLAAFRLWRGRAQARERHRLIGWSAVTAVLLSAPWFWLNAGETRSLRRFEDGIADLPRFARAYAFEEVGKYHRKAGRGEEAEAAYRRCVEIFPGNPRFRGALGALLFHAGELTGAERELREAARDTTAAEAPFLLAMIHAEWGDFAAALEWARRTSASPRESARAAALHGAMAEELGLPEEAIAAYRRAASRDPRRADLLERAGALALDAGDPVLAEGLFRAALSRDPRLEGATAGLLIAGRERLRSDPGAAAGEAGLRRVRELIGLLGLLDQRGLLDPSMRPWREELLRLEERLTASGAAR